MYVRSVRFRPYAPINFDELNPQPLPPGPPPPDVFSFRFSVSGF